MKLFDGNEYPESLIRDDFPYLHQYCLDHKCFEEVILFKETNPFHISPLYFIIVAAILGLFLPKLWLDGKISNLLFTSYFTFFLVFITLSFQYYANKFFYLKDQPVRIIKILDGNLYLFESGSLIYSGSLTRVKIRRARSPIGDSLYPFILFRKCFHMQISGIKNIFAFGMSPLFYNIFDDYLKLQTIVKQS